MSERPQISIAMATFNGADYLTAQLESLVAQTLPPCELVITDDGSTDDTKYVVTAFAARSPFPVHWHDNDTRLGYRANFMRAASLCSGELIAFCDQDDIWYPEKLETAAVAFSDADVMLFHHEAKAVRDCVVLSERVRKVSSTQPLIPALQAAPWQFPFGYTEVFRATLRDYDSLWSRSTDFKGLSKRSTHDQWYYFLATVLGTIAFHSLPLAECRQHAGNTFSTGTTTYSRFDKLRFLLENRAPIYRRLAEAARSRALLLKDAERSAGNSQTMERLGIGSNAWQRLSVAYVNRAAVYEGGLLSRITSMIALLSRKAYNATGFWNFGSKAVAKDVFLGVVLGPIVTRYGRPATGEDWTCAAGDGSAVAQAYAQRRMFNRNV